MRHRSLMAVVVTVTVAWGCAGRARPHADAPAAPAASATTPAYSALGGGHLLKAVSDDGRLLTLEDGSVWEIHPSVRFQTVDWQPQAVITVHTTRGQDGYTYEVVNTSADEGALAKYVAPRGGSGILLHP